MVAIKTLCTAVLLAGVALVESKACKKPFIRREWRSLSLSERDRYIKAQKCLMNKPSQSSPSDIPGARNRWDDFLGTHIINADDVHFVGVFYPYHRLLMHAYEQELQTCGWKGGVPYWDWTLDAAGPDNDTSVFYDSPIFDNKHGFGGNGAWVPGNFSNPEPGLPVNPPWDVPDRSGGGCIKKGPFTGLKSNLGPGNGTTYNPNCIRRDFAPLSFRDMSGPDAIKDGMRQKDFGFFDRVTESTFHSGGHWGVGGLYGTMTDKWQSPADPLFWVHHANVDRAWWSWQIRDLKKREKDVSGPLVNFDYANQAAGNVTLNHPIAIFETRQLKAKVKDVMHIRKGLLCYDYEDTY
ncbi:unnamed protein product [Fusarium graminearum]|uniref:Uncharacterized protein n=1 Tax=Gibberella zeae TaxID=5518 RepID=A0A2H3GS61_GIBZA|nr:hypothetical protein FGRA07_02828 [Fusarium graminearum]CAF3562928.1 unnamed protein product [Fusarium graminearum]CAG1997577.1 unnamed protein product [Fusarium graminearum]CAG2008901.1 unnamed protein product [Fusarium graminearum]CZS81962.1 unnamed protein product [Fusarium graminearum]